VATTLTTALVEAERTGSFSLSDPNLGTFPVELRRLRELRVLRLVHCGITTVPDWLGELKALVVLDLAENPIELLPAAIGRLPTLRSLRLAGCRLTSIEALRRLTGLEELVVANNVVHRIPSWIGELADLVFLNAGGNRLQALPSELARLSRLTHLLLPGHQFAEFPPAIRGLRQLAILDLSRGGTFDLPFRRWESDDPRDTTVFYTSHFSLRGDIDQVPDWIVECSALRGLGLGGQSITTLPPLPRHVSKLYLDNNSLAEFPPAVLKLTQLKVLDLSNNTLSSLPVELTELHRLTFLGLTGNPLPIPPEVLELADDPAAIAQYVAGVHAQPRRLDEAKLLVVGEGSVGKTSLIRRLTGSGFAPHEPKTEGIEVSEMTVDVGEAPVQLNIWDFGGQEIMHATHQFFLTKRSLYVLVVDARQSEQQNRVEYWLKLIHSFSDGSPVIIVANKSEPLILDMDVRGLKAKYTNIVDIVPVSCKVRAGLDEVQALLAASVERMDHVRDVLPASYFDVKRELERLDVNYLSYEDYQSICRRHGVDAPTSQEVLVGFLHDLGTVLCFREDRRLSNTNILNPEWVTGGVYLILNAHLAAQRKGLLKWADIEAILDTGDYPPGRRTFIVDMMQRFELCYELDGTFLVPDLLTKEEPDTGSWDGALRFEIRYPVLPSSIISRLIVRMNRRISKGTVWRTGLVVAMERNRALVKSDAEDGLVTILVDGPSSGRRHLLSAIRTELRAIQDTIPGLTGEERVPVPGHPGHWVSYRRLLEFEEVGRDLVVPDGLTDDFSVRELLAGVETRAERRPSGRMAEVAPALAAARDEGARYDDGAPGAWTAGEAMRFGRILVGALVVLVAVFVAANVVVGAAAAAAITGVALAAVIVIGALMLRSSERLSEQGLLESIRSATQRAPRE
jgi:small GTP-binding protein